MRFARTTFGAPALALFVWAAGAYALAATPLQIVGVEGELLETIRNALPEREPPATLFDAERVAEEAADRARAVLRAEGYYAAVVEPETPEAEPPSARLLITPGPRFTLRPPELGYAGEAPVDEAQKAVRAALSEAIEAGAPARARAVLDAEAAAVAALRSAGYAEARAEDRRVVVDHAANAMAATFTLAPGPRVRLGDVRLAENSDLLRDSYQDKLPRWEAGDPYDPDEIASLRRSLASTGAFSIVSADLEDAPGEDGLRDVIVSLEPAEPRVIEIGVGWSSMEGLGAEAEWTRRNITRRADTLTIGTILAEQQQSLTAALQRPNAIGAERALTLAAGVVNDNTAAFERIGASVSATIDDTRRDILGLSYGVAISADFYNEEVGPENAYTLSGFAEARIDETDALLDPREGYILEARVEPAASFGDAQTIFVRGVGEARGYYSAEAAERFTLAARLKAGWIEPISGDDDDLPLDRRFFAGGGGSVRGYEFNSIAPTRLARTTPIGGRGLLETSIEGRARVTERIGAVAFVDGGAAFNRWEEIEPLWGAGVGFRYDLGFAPLRVDLAVPIDARERDDAYAIYVSIGQAF